MFDNFSHPLFLLLFALSLGLIIARKTKYFLRHAHIKIVINVKRKNWGGAMLNALPIFVKWLAWILLILAAADYSSGYVEYYHKDIIHQYILIDDGSGSMIDGAAKNGVGKSLKALLAGNEKFLTTLENLKRPDGGKDQIAATIFSNDVFVVSYFTEDYDFIRKKLNQVDWRIRPLNLGTEMDKAIWLGIKMILKRNSESQGTFYSEDEMASLNIRAVGSGRQFDLENLPTLKSKTEKIKNEIKGSALVIFTDGQITFDGHQFRMSVAKLLLFCKSLGIRVYLISVDQIESDLTRYIKETGGDGLIIRGMDTKKITDAYTNIVNREAGEYIVSDRRQKRSYAEWLAGAGLALLTFYIMLKNTVSRSLTEI